VAAAHEQRKLPGILRQRALVQFFGLLILFVVLAAATLRTRLVAPNEGWFADPALHLVTKGFFGTTILESSGTWLEGINRHTYWILPLHGLALAAVYRIFGFSLFTTRALSVAWGLVALSAFFFLIRSQAGHGLALLATLLVATDFHFLVAASVGRMDMMCAALGFCSIATYVILRESSFRTAMLLGHTLAAAACFTHPCGILAVSALALLAFRLDRRRLSWRTAALACLPYAAGLAAYGAYALQDLPSFFRQLSGNVSGLAGEATGSTRFGGLTEPWVALRGEILNRYISAFVGGSWKDAYRPQLLILLLYWGGAIVAVLDNQIRCQKAARLLLSLAALFWVILWLFEGLKLRAYIVHTLPLFAGLGALWIWNWTKGRTFLRTAVVAVILCIQFLGIGYGVWIDQYQNEYLSAATYMKQHGHAGSLIMASGEFAFEFGFDGRVVDDVRLGYFSGKRPEFYVRDVWYADWLEKLETRDPAVYHHVRDALTEFYREVFRNPGYTIYQLR
jgi:hypothetical protein